MKPARFLSETRHGVALFFALLSVPALATEVTLTSDTQQLKVQLASAPGAPAGSGLHVMSWSGLTEGDPAGVMVFKEHPKSDGSGSYFRTVNEGAPFSLENTYSTYFLAHFTGRRQPIRLKANPGEKPSPQALWAAYSEAQGHGGEGAARMQLQAKAEEGLKAFNSACGGGAKLGVDWKSFESGGKLSWAGAAYGVLVGLADLCADVDYKAELAKVTSFDFDWKDAGSGDFAFKRTPTQIRVSMGRNSYNPRQFARAWAKKDF